MEVIPAIDIMEGKSVRLLMGDFGKKEVFPGDPVFFAKRWKEEGAKTLHVVDLDGARYGTPKNLRILSKIKESVDIRIEFGGGLRDILRVREAFLAGADRVIIGTGAFDRPFIKRAVSEFGERIMVAVDSDGGFVRIKGWMEGTDVRATDLVKEMADLGVRLFLFTDIKRDGTLTAPNFDAVKEVVSLGDFGVIVSGGISKIEHIKRLREIGVYGAVIGRALYKGLINLREAIKVAEGYSSEV